MRRFTSDWAWTLAVLFCLASQLGAAADPGWRTGTGADEAPLYTSQAARLDRWKAVRPEIAGSADRVELYDLWLDPQESQDLSEREESCDVMMQLETMMNAAHVAPPEDPTGRFEVPALDGLCPWLFADGFESGDVSAWSGSQG